MLYAPGRANVPVKDVGHFVMIDDPATFNSLPRTELALMTGRVQSL
jgi:hypothetical protein